MRLLVHLNHLVVQKNHQLSSVKSVSRHEEASDRGDYFAQQGGKIAQQNLPILVVVVEPPVVQ